MMNHTIKTHRFTCINGESADICPYCGVIPNIITTCKEYFWIECPKCQAESYTDLDAGGALRSWNLDVGPKGRSQIISSLKSLSNRQESN